MTFLHLSLILSLLWIGSLIYAQKRRKSILKWQDEPISAFIKHDKVLQLGFILLGFSLISAGTHFGSYAIPIFTTAGVGAVIVMLTKKSISGTLHKIAAILTYLLALVGAVMYSSTDFLLGIAVANVMYCVFAGIVQDELGDAERYIALGLISWIGLSAVTGTV